MWHQVYNGCWDAPDISLGARGRATGEIGQYEGELQIEPSFGGDLKTIEGAAAWATPREIGSLSGSDDGQRVMIEGTVTRPNNTALGTPGSRVRVVGTVEVYKGDLEVIPTLPYDVVVLETPLTSQGFGIPARFQR
jgi:hypothetical protein